MATIKVPATNKVNQHLMGFDREAMYAGSKELGILEFCYSAASGEVYQIGSDSEGTYTLLTSQTTFGDGTALADRTIIQYKDPSMSHFTYWFGGQDEDVTTSKTLQLDVGFNGYIYYDADGNLANSVQVAGRLIKEFTLISYIGLNLNKIWYFADERHGILQDGETHLQRHTDVGFYLKQFMRITGVANNVSTFTAITAGVGADEDITMVLASISTIPKLYKLGAYFDVSQDDNELALLDTSVAQVNSIPTPSSNGTLVDLTGNDRMGMVMVATNNKIHPLMMIVGQTAYADRGTARKNISAEWFRIKVFGLPSPEMHTAYVFILDSDGAIETGADGEICLDAQHTYPFGIFS